MHQSTTMTHLWEMQTSWFPKPDTEYINSTFTYKSWKDFQDCKPYKLWKPYILSSWSWKRRKIDDLELQRSTKPKHGKDASILLRANPSSPAIKSLPEEADMLQIVFLSPDRFSGMHRAEMIVTQEDEESIKEWLKSHMPGFWKL